jgi:hypothetical protein
LLGAGFLGFSGRPSRTIGVKLGGSEAGKLSREAVSTLFGFAMGRLRFI